jgi:hypothetical protein
VLCVSLARKVFLDHPQNYLVCCRGIRPSSVRVSDKQNIQKMKSKNKSKKTRVRQTRLDWLWGWSKISRCKKKNQKKIENYTKSNKRSNLDHLFPSSGARKRGLLTVYKRIKLQVDLQEDKSPVVVKGPLFPRVVKPRYRICGTMRDARVDLVKPRNIDLQEVKPVHLISKNIKTNLIY